MNVKSNKSTKKDEPVVKKDDTRERFINELSDLLKKYCVSKYAGVYVIQGSELLSYGGDITETTALLKKAHSKCKEQVMAMIGE